MQNILCVVQDPTNRPMFQRGKSSAIDGEILIIANSPSNQGSSNSKINIKEVGKKFNPQNEYEKSAFVFDDVSDSSDAKNLDQFLKRGRHKTSRNYGLPQSFFDLPKRTIRNKSNIFILFQQSLKDVENIDRDIAGCDMKYDKVE